MSGLLVIMGSGETAPTMVKPHRAVLERVGERRAVLLDISTRGHRSWQIRLAGGPFYPNTDLCADPCISSRVNLQKP
jgi:hypothetical protein